MQGGWQLPLILPLLAPHVCPSKEICQSFKYPNEHARSARKPLVNYSRICVFVRGDLIVEKEFDFCCCLLAVSIFYDSTEFEHHISLNSESVSVHTPTVYNLKNMSCAVCVIENMNAHGVNSHLIWENLWHFKSGSFRPSISIYFCF